MAADTGTTAGMNPIHPVQEQLVSPSTPKLRTWGSHVVKNEIYLGYCYSLISGGHGQSRSRCVGLPPGVSSELSAATV